MNSQNTAPSFKAWKTLKKNALRLFVFFLLFTSFYLVWMIGQGPIDWSESRIFLSSIIVAFTGLCLMSCAVYAEKRGKRTWGRLGFLLVSLNSALWFIGLWNGITEFWYWRGVGILSTITLSMCYGFVLNAFWLDARFRWLQWLTFPLLAILTLCVSNFIYHFSSLGFKQEEWLYQLGVSAAILLALMTILVPTLHRLGAPKKGSLPKKLRLVYDQHEIYRDAWGLRYKVIPLDLPSSVNISHKIKTKVLESLHQAPPSSQTDSPEGSPKSL